MRWIDIICKLNTNGYTRWFLHTWQWGEATWGTWLHPGRSVSTDTTLSFTLCYDITEREFPLIGNENEALKYKGLRAYLNKICSHLDFSPTSSISLINSTKWKINIIFLTIFTNFAADSSNGAFITSLVIPKIIHSILFKLPDNANSSHCRFTSRTNPIPIL